MTNQPIEEKWKKKLRDLYLITVPDANGLFTKSITFNWGKFEYNPKDKKTEFYLATKESIESFIENLLEQEKKRMSEEIMKMQSDDYRVYKSAVIATINK